MSEHFTRDTVSASGWCAKCYAMTQHRVDDRRLGPCLPCLERPLPVQPVKEAKQESGLLFDPKQWPAERRKN